MSQVNIEVTFEPVPGNYCGAAGLIENVVLMGSPICSNNDAEWQAVKALVSGRLVNVYSKHDWVLGLIFRYKQYVASSTSRCLFRKKSCQCLNGIGSVAPCLALDKLR